MKRDVTHTAVAMEQLSKHFSAETNTNNNRRAVFSVQSVPSVYKEDKEYRLSQSRVESGSKTSTVALRVVGGDEKGTQCLWV
jgi:hypothetical protein